MNGKKIWITIGIVLAIFALLVVGAVIFMTQHVMVDFKFYPKNEAVLDLRDRDIEINHFNALSEKLPDTRILWNVPFQKQTYSSDIQELKVTSLSETDVKRIAYLDSLKLLDARDCTDYEQILRVRQTYPELEMLYSVPINGQQYAQDAQQLEVTAITAQELNLLPCLTELKSVVVGGGEDTTNIDALQSYCHENGIEFSLALGNQVFPDSVDQVRVEGLADAEILLMGFMPQLRKIHLVNPKAAPAYVQELANYHEALKVTWEVEIWGKTITMEDTEVDLSEAQPTTLEEVENGLAYFPQVTSVFLGEPGFDNEEIAAYRERSREKYKVVWVVDLSGKMKVRTDIDNFMPSRDGWGYVRDHEIDNIRYCEDLICIDIGHMGIKDVSFLEPLVNLEYLILAHTEVQYIDAISNCKKLKFLELDWSGIRDLTPLVECTALEDLNLGMTWPDLTPIHQMKWLKNLYLINGNCKGNWPELLPNTRVVTRGTATVASGWRNLPNYYKMRDILGMYYMSAGY